MERVEIVGECWLWKGALNVCRRCEVIRNREYRKRKALT